jgi:TusA-related sulfurtransferase
MALQILNHVDARHMSCPMPIVKTARAIKTIASGTLVEVLVTDPGPSRTSRPGHGRPATS